ncbi:helix-turn-helix domain-containing protein [Cloacibacillus porcorum]
MFKNTALAEWRKTLEITAHQAAKMIGITQAFYSELESGKKTPSFKTLEAIIEQTGLDSNALISSSKSNSGTNPNACACMDYFSEEHTSQNNLVSISLRAWKEGRDAVDALDPAILANGLEIDDLQKIHKEATEAIESFKKVCSHIEPRLKKAV